jgi:hypothetical protein
LRSDKMMKRWFMPVLIALSLVNFAWADCTQQFQEVGDQAGVSTLTFVCTAASDGSYRAWNTSPDVTGAILGRYLTMVEVVPGVTAPTASYAATIKDTYGNDIAGGVITSLSASAAAQFMPAIGSVYGARPISTALALGITGNSIASANTTFILYLAR